MRALVGTSGFSYAGWTPSFYPEGTRGSEMLSYYATRFGAVEINNTFYRMPTAKDVARWSEQTDPSFAFALKAPRRITHSKKLSEESADDVAHLLDVASGLGSRRGPVLFQLPPYLRKDAARLTALLSAADGRGPIALEFRHASWQDDEVLELLRAHDAALCAADTDEAEAQLIPTASWGYLRLRRTDYDEAALASWAERIAAQGWETAYVFLKHEDEGRAPALAARLQSLLAERGGITAPSGAGARSAERAPVRR